MPLHSSGRDSGLVLIYTGALRSDWTLVYVHLGLSFIGVGLIAAARIGWLSRHALVRVAAVLVTLAVLAPVARYLRETRWSQHARIETLRSRPLPWPEKATALRVRSFPAPHKSTAEKKSQPVLHGIRFLQALPRRYL